LTIGVLIGRFTIAPVARAQNACSAATLKGPYGLAVNGFFYDADGFQGIYASAGLMVADGAGGLTGTDTVNFDGTPTRARHLTGTYTVNADCTGTMKLADAQGNATNMDLVITGSGQNVELVDYDTDLILHGTARPQ
jgi:hypothetical protein